MRILHLSDTHLTRDAGPNHYGVDPAASLRLMLRDCGELRELDAVVVTGDVADDGTSEAYAQAWQLIGGFARAVWATPGVVTRIDPTAPLSTVRAVRGASASLVDLGGPHSPVLHTLHTRDPETGRVAYETGAQGA
ncbi:hypothetical protein Acy02nite_55590 [Actinoplanes cyaneus]|uniref:Calcineurin-like phosphoesterase domain-containing protein n=1 Tax=Actinoplanes cyaneus TaxID=52696 RepID=A0A919IQG6_9ACTN|nr:metallophosphoesterase [Actinoplanes cyaneus]MCW2140021.1 Calcineurin-like phosphoesterase [Actinoplanes cyaneus]GID67678.1 hypothetical protein Acy02nite_55590 [Actinoplanes cyaneus]